ncbi:A-kinase anchor protein 200 [Drosophila montana]|uniref:A-kinase anchor protein 200 n=1 Tax=Drosophila montana TaxID=40370 RepID=UPI00313D2250
MGKAQSKRSIDITTDPKKVGEGDEVAGKVEKIEDVDQASAPPALNGDAATTKEKSPGSEDAAGAAGAAEKKETEENSENDKDLTTEKKTADSAPKSDGASGDASAESAKDEAVAASGSPKEGSGAEEISPLADESIKSKSKKDKVKKKWSFRSISFGKKDKQKPAKTEEPASPTAVAAASSESAPTNGEAEQRPAEAEGAPAAAAAADKEEQSADAAPADAATKVEPKPTENGAASEQEKQPQEPQANGDDKTSAPTVSEEAVKSETTPTTESKVEAVEQSAVPEPVSSNDTTEAVTNGHGVVELVLTNGDKNGLAESPTEPEAAPVNSAGEEPHHQNGTNGVGENNDTATPPPTPVAETESEADQIKNKSQIEVKQQQLDTTNNTVNTSITTTTTTRTTTTGTENNSTITITETETIAAAELVQTQPTNTQNNTIPNITTNTTDNSVYLPTSQAQDEVQAADAAEEEQVVAAIIAAVSEPSDSEGFVFIAPPAETDLAQAELQAEPEQETAVVCVSPVLPNLELESDAPKFVPEPNPDADVLVSVADSAEANVVTVEFSQPPPLPKSPPPSRVSAFALTTDDETPDNDDDSFVNEEAKQEDIDTPAPTAEDGPLLADIEHQAHAFVEEITEQAADIVTEQDKQKPLMIEDVTLENISEELMSSAVKIVTDVDADDNDDIEEEEQLKKTEQVSKDEELVEQPEIICDDKVNDDVAEDGIKEGEQPDDISEKIIAVADDFSLRGNDSKVTFENVPELEDMQRDSDDDNDNDKMISSDNSSSLTKLDAFVVDIKDAAHLEDIAKDLKEKNAAADVTTQDLPVTCE